MLLAATGEELMQWLRPMIKLIRARQRLWNSMFLGSYHDRALFTLSHDPIQWVNLEFKDRDLREFPVIPPPDFDKQCRACPADRKVVWDCRVILLRKRIYNHF